MKEVAMIYFFKYNNSKPAGEATHEATSALGLEKKKKFEVHETAAGDSGWQESFLGHEA